MTCIIFTTVNAHNIGQNKYTTPNLVKKRIKETYQKRKGAI
ncbi:hypothetical protein FQV37_499 [Psychrobacter nivimaris]|uniref:Uncharacterized protein n=1 Tax=Psychrobacter nivimaris TaxID=281738 RepID=A0A6N7BZ76_9GAMM|nr:hypothetical protein FQV37_499 [Psychrobacter nivimaris]